MPRTAAPVWRTIRMMDAARRQLGWGAATIDLHGLFVGAAGELPYFFEAGNGCEVLDTAGRRYIDWYLSGGCLLLGHRRREVDEAIVRQLARGTLLPALNPLELEVASSLCELLPCAEVVAFGKNGSDMLTAAIRLARATTGKAIILHHGFHGFQDWFAATDAAAQGIPRETARVHSFPYNDIQALEALLGRHRGEVAAVVMEPTKHELPRPGYLERVRELTRQHRALLVFDEVVTFLRLGVGGAQTLFGVVPDLACLGKSLGNGMPLSAVVGPREIMRHFPTVGVGMTFQAEALSLAAARTTLNIVRDEPVASHVARVGETVREAFIFEARRLGLLAELTGHPARMTIFFSSVGPFPSAYLLGLFITCLLERGVITSGTMLASAAHDDVAVQKTIDAVRASLRVVAATVQSGIFRGWVLPEDAIALGYFDRITEDEGSLEVAGWLLIEGRPANRIEIELEDGLVVATEVVIRSDVADALPHASAPQECGFRARLPLVATDSAFRAILYARSEHNEMRCVVLYQTGAARTPTPIPIRAGRIINL